MNNWSVYLLRCSDGSLYCGVTTDVERRLDQHAAGAGSKYVRSRLPIKEYMHVDGFTKSAALKSERLIKSLPARDKVKMLRTLAVTKSMRTPSTKCSTSR